MKRENIKKWLATAADVLFVLILCFAVLLTTMVITTSGEATQRTDYSVNALLFSGVILSIGGYLIFMLRHSLKALNRMIDRFSAHSEHRMEGEQS